ncbi:hypothetical protein ACFVZ3_40355 [Kitasatospora purpeofusca]|uniref:hypothetical protein n=1 Tax=Kitasatospora purpeofusca TaxID=67352 RepID=UPI00365576EA|nr:hypothetical protein KPHV_79870 [Kitasatospora purpeofusca]
MLSDHRALLGSVTATLRAAGLPLADAVLGTGGATVSDGVHGVIVSWQAATRGAASEASGAAGVDGARLQGGAAVRSRHFQATLRVAALLAEVGFHSEHLGDRVLVSGRSAG